MEQYTLSKKLLKYAAFQELPLGAIKPYGWLKDQLQVQANGLTGHLDEVWEDVGGNNGWLGGSGDSWERGPYYLDGLLPLAYLLEDEVLINKVRPWVEWTLTHQRSDGQFGPISDVDWWPRMIMIKVLIQYEEVTGDKRVIPFLNRYFKYQRTELPRRPLSGWGHARGGENILGVQWLYARTGDESLVDLMNLIYEQTMNWKGILVDFQYSRYQRQFDHRIHVVNVAMGIKTPALHYLLSGELSDFQAPAIGIASLMTHHGQVYGMFSGDEWLAGTHPSQGVELCAVVEYMYSLQHLIRVSGDSHFADILEKVTFNALPATISADWHSHQYDQQANQVQCTVADRNWTQNGDDSNLFGLSPNFGCCTANMHQGWPKYTSHLWMATQDGGLAAISFAPCRIETQVADHIGIQIDVNTNYPFDEEINVVLRPATPVQFPLLLHIPAWCLEPTVAVNGKMQPISLVDGFLRIERKWLVGDQIQILLPMRIQLESRPNYAVGIQRGPLVYALGIGERWQKVSGTEPFADYEIYPETAWNYGLLANTAHPESSFEVHRQAMGTQPFSPLGNPVKITARGRRIPNWGLTNNSAGEPPLSPVKSSEPVEQITLVPYASARLRIAEFPVLSD